MTRDEEIILDAKRKLSTEFEMKYLGMMHYLLVMEGKQSTNGILLGQGKYAVEILKRFRMLDCKVMATPMASNLKLLCDDSSESVDSNLCFKVEGKRLVMFLLCVAALLF